MYHGAVVIMSQFCLRKKSRVRSSTTSPIPWTKDVTVFWIGLLGCAHAASNGPTPCAMFFCILATSCVIFAIHVTCNIPIYSRCWSSFALISPIFLCFHGFHHVWIHHPIIPCHPGRQASSASARPSLASPLRASRPMRRSSSCPRLLRRSRSLMLWCHAPKRTTRVSGDIPGDIPGDDKWRSPWFFEVGIDKALAIHFWPQGHDSFS